MGVRRRRWLSIAATAIIGAGAVAISLDLVSSLGMFQYGTSRLSTGREENWEWRLVGGCMTWQHLDEPVNANALASGWRMKLDAKKALEYREAHLLARPFYRDGRQPYEWTEITGLGFSLMTNHTAPAGAAVGRIDNEIAVAPLYPLWVAGGLILLSRYRKARKTQRGFAVEQRLEGECPQSPVTQATLVRRPGG